MALAKFVNPKTGIPFSQAIVNNAGTCPVERQAMVATATLAPTVNLPAAPAQDQIIAILDKDGNAATNNITVSGNGKNIGGAASILIKTNSGGVVVMYDADEGQWRQIVCFRQIDDGPAILYRDDAASTATAVPATDTGVVRVSGGAFANSANFTEDGAGNASLASSLKIGATPATAGTVRLPSGASISARNVGNTDDLSLVTTDASDRLFIGTDTAFTSTKQPNTINIFASATIDLGIGAGDVLLLGSTIQAAKPYVGESAASSPWGVHGKVDVAIAGNTTLTAAQYQYSAIKFTGAPGAGFTVTFPTPASDAAGYWKWLWNATGQIATIQLAAGTTKTLGVGNGAWFWFDTGGARQAGAAIAP
jgi:hypothetical protein